jgi:hypothetical protein
VLSWIFEKNSQKMTWSLEMNVKKRKENVGTNPPGLQGTGLSNRVNAPHQLRE